ncbi:MAG: helix-turn-helix transcriptional regulator [Dehalococcoidales bacterium]
MENIGEELRIRRLLKKLTQTEVSKSAGITQIAISNIERGLHNPTPRTIARIRHAIDKLPAKEVKNDVKTTE